MSQPKTHKYSYQVESAEIMPDYVREQYRREGLSGTLCGYMRPKTSAVAQDITCAHCLRLMAKAAA